MWKGFWSPRDTALVDVGAAGELMAARGRLQLAALVLLIPLIGTFASHAVHENYVGLVAAAFEFLVSGTVLLFVQRGYYVPWLGLVLSVTDVTVLSLVLARFVAMGASNAGVNSHVVYALYFVAIGLTCLRYDAQLSLITGIAAAAGYAAVVVYALNNERLTGRFDTISIGDQLARIFILLLGTLMSYAVVRRLERLRQLSTHDGLTGLLNRGIFVERLEEEVMRARRYQHPLALAVIDLDDFKAFNDTHGHAAGDAALSALGDKLRAMVRRSDVVARFGGEEFIILLPETAEEDAWHKLERIRVEVAAMQIALPRTHGPGRLTLSAGISSLPADGVTAEALLHRADDLLFAAKRAGRNCVLPGTVPALEDGEHLPRAGDTHESQIPNARPGADGRGRRM